MKRLLAAAATLTLLATAAPALAAPAKNGACKAPAGATLIKPGAKAAESTAPTPVGAVNEGGVEQAGTFVLDLSGKPQGQTGKLTFTLSWDNPLSDYDLIIGGTNDLSTDNPEVRAVKARHCKPVPVEVGVYTGVPIDELTLAVKGS